MGVIFALLTTEPQWRADNLAYDFDKRGRIRRTRVPRAPTCVIRAHNVNWLPVYHDTYVLTGGYNTNGWLLQHAYDDNIKAHWLRAGLVMAPAKVISSPHSTPSTSSGDEMDPEGLDTYLKTFTPHPINPHDITNTWEFSHVGRLYQLRRYVLSAVVVHDVEVLIVAITILLYYLRHLPV